MQYGAFYAHWLDAFSTRNFPPGGLAHLEPGDDDGILVLFTSSTFSTLVCIISRQLLGEGPA
ncbi:hypothetical protein PMIN01_12323 [Paraphaeosphaeria minitans]|uniref:Uncharacterized protein n=1 Tax=Paraphaeosphaeria minitans TaxID=565426 RepID=A0A9P6KKH1_9PLEO|nr:hypothetical protein PMIN01_12323 [Paraphaeosphaeria minitans]